MDKSYEILMSQSRRTMMTKKKEIPLFTGTAAELRTKLDERAAYARKIYDAMMRGDHDGCALAQKEMRETFAGKSL